MNRIIVDSCTDLNEEMKGYVNKVPLTLYVGDEEIIDDDLFNQKEFLEKVKNCEKGSRSACPSPNSYMEEFLKDEKDMYCITLSSKLSGSYSSAVLGKEMALEKFGKEKNIHIFDSKSAASGQTLVLLKIKECIDLGLEFFDVVKEAEEYIKSQTTLFVLETLESLRKNGRLSLVKSKVINALNIKPIMSSTPEGEIKQLAIARGMSGALSKMAKIISDTVENPCERILCISHCNAIKNALFFKNELLKYVKFKDIIIVQAGGVSSLYACDGGIVVSY